MVVRQHQYLFVSLLCIFSLSATACGDENAKAAKKDIKKPAAAKFKSPTVDKTRARKGNLDKSMTPKTFDLNQDGKADQWRYSNGAGQLLRIEHDLNFDGKIDQWRYADKNGEVVEEEMDLDRDGKIDVVTFYKGGIIARKELSLNFSSRFELIKIYDSRGELLRVERDSDGDGQTDVWEYYENKKRVRVGWDKNKDGVPDTFDKLI